MLEIKEQTGSTFCSQTLQNLLGQMETEQMLWDRVAVSSVGMSEAVGAWQRCSASCLRDQREAPWKKQPSCRFLELKIRRQRQTKKGPGEEICQYFMGMRKG